MPADEIRERTAHRGEGADQLEMPGAIVDEQVRVLACIIVAVERNEQFDRAVVVEIGGDDRFAVATKAKRSKRRVLRKAAGAIADV